MATNFARTRKAPSRSGSLHYAFCPKCDSEYGGWRGMTQDLDAAQAQADEHNAEAHEEPSVAKTATERAEEDLTLSTEEAWALPRPADESYQVGQRIICVNLSHIGATVRSLDDTGVGLDYDNDDEEDKEFGYEALYSHIRPMPLR